MHYSIFLLLNLFNVSISRFKIFNPFALKASGFKGAITVSTAN
jgi:hypothetical protein